MDFENRIERWQKQKIKLLVLTGRRKSGKNAFVEYLAHHYPQFGHYRIAEAPVLIAQILELPPSREILHALFDVNDLLRPLLGESAYKRRVARMLDREEPPLALVEAIRTKEEYEEFAVRREGLLVGIIADDTIRYQRAVQDGNNNREKRDEADLTLEEFIKKEQAPIERDIGWILKRSHYTIENNADLSAFHNTIERLMQKLDVNHS